MWKKITWQNIDSEFVVRNTLGDGSCLIHSVLYSISEDYKESSDSLKRKIGRNIRDQMSEFLPEYWKYIINEEAMEMYEKAKKEGELEDISDVYSVDYKIKELLSSCFLDENIVHYLSILFNINIIVYSKKNKDIYQLGVDKIIDYDKEAVVLIAYNGKHFETIAEKIDDDHLMILFPNDSKTINRILENANKQIKE